MQGRADVAEGLLDQRDLDRLLAHQMLVQGGGPDDLGLVAVGHLMGRSRLTPPPEEKVEVPTRSPHVAHPFALAPRRDEVLMTVEGQEVDGGPPGEAALAARDLEDPAPPDAD